MKTIVLGFMMFFFCLSGFSQEIFMYGEGGEKIYFQKIDSLVLVKFKKDVSHTEKLAIARMINPDKDYSGASIKERILIPVLKNRKTNYAELTKNKSVIYVNQSLMSTDGTIQIPTDKVLVKIKSKYELEEVLNKLSVDYESYKRLGHDKNSYMVILKNGESLTVANTLYESGYFEYAQPSFTRLMKPMNEYYEDQWNLDNTGQYGGTAGIDIFVPKAWEMTKGCSDVAVAVIDQGVDLDHPDLAGNLLAGYDATDGGNGGDNGDCWGNDAHGTACAGIVASIDNTIGTIGVAPNCKIIPIRVTYTINDNEIWDDDWVVDGINYAWETSEADILSCSWGGGSPVLSINNEITAALNQGRNNLGCIVVFSTGNDNASVRWPANSNPDIIAVGAMSPCGERKNPNSCDGENWGSNYGNELDLVAPGVLIPTTDIQAGAGYNPNLPIHPRSGGSKIANDYSNQDYTIWFNGTSAATPHVAGVAALILSVNPGLTQDEVRDKIESTCRKVGGYSYSTVSGRNNGSWNNQTGYGLVDAYAVLRQALDMQISGPGDICFSWSFFSVDNLPSGDSITWNQSDNISRHSQQGSNPCLFVGTTSGAGWVEATINTSSCSFTLPRKAVWVGVPDYTQLDISLESGKLISCGYVSGTSKYNGTPWPGIDAYEWYLPNAQNWNVEDESSMPAIAYKYVELEYWEDPAPSQEDIYIRAHNSCGWSEWKHTIWSVVDNCGWYLIFSPDSDTGGTKITIASGTAEKSFAETTEWNLEIYNQSQLLKEKKIKLKGNSTVINTSGWQEGVYTVQVKFDDEVLTDKLLIKR